MSPWGVAFCFLVGEAEPFGVGRLLGLKVWLGWLGAAALRWPWLLGPKSLGTPAEPATLVG
jgi:hypothetical protein